MGQCIGGERRGGLGHHCVTCGGLYGRHLLVWCGMDASRETTVLGLASGAVAGLATVTPAAGYIGPLSAIAIGLVAGMSCYAAIVWKGDSAMMTRLTSWASTESGVIGVLATGLFASKVVNAGGADGLFFGNPGLFGIQLLVVVVTTVFSLVGTFAILKLVDAMTGLRVSPEEEATGLDLSQHNERAYS